MKIMRTRTPSSYLGVPVAGTRDPGEFGHRVLLFRRDRKCVFDSKAPARCGPREIRTSRADGRPSNCSRVVQHSVFTGSAMPGEGESRHSVRAWLSAGRGDCKKGMDVSVITSHVVSSV